jgi:hypothetical protein
MTQDEKVEADGFYSHVRNPVAHGLTRRIFERYMGRPPKTPFEADVDGGPAYARASHEILDRIYHWMAVKNLRAQ